MSCMPPCFDENRPAMEVYALVRNQIIVAPMGGAIAVDINAINVALKYSGLHGIASRRRVFHQVLLLGNHFIGKMNAERKD